MRVVPSSIHGALRGSPREPASGRDEHRCRGARLETRAGALGCPRGGARGRRGDGDVGQVRVGGRGGPRARSLRVSSPGCGSARLPPARSHVSLGSRLLLPRGGRDPRLSRDARPELPTAKGTGMRRSVQGRLSEVAPTRSAAASTEGESVKPRKLHVIRCCQTNGAFLCGRSLCRAGGSAGSRRPRRLQAAGRGLPAGPRCSRRASPRWAPLTPAPSFLQDEPSSGMDPCSKRLLWQAIREEARRGCAVVLTTHR